MTNIRGHSCCFHVTIIKILASISIFIFLFQDHFRFSMASLDGKRHFKSKYPFLASKKDAVRLSLADFVAFEVLSRKNFQFKDNIAAFTKTLPQNAITIRKNLFRIL